jgi:hypothetical protein
MIKAHRQLLGKNIVSNSAIYVRGLKDAMKFNSLSDPLGDLWLSRNVEFLIRIELITLEQGKSITSYEEVTRILEQSLHVIAANKRSAIFRLKEFTLSINQYGLISFLVSQNYPAKGKHYEDYTWCADLLRDILIEKGVYVERHTNNGKAIYNYTALEESIVLTKYGFVLINEDVSGNYHVGSSDSDSAIEVEFFATHKAAAKERRDIVKSTGNKDFIVRKAKLTDNGSRLIVYRNSFEDKAEKVLLLIGNGDTFHQAITLDASAPEVA